MKLILFLALNFYQHSAVCARENATWIRSTFFRGIDPDTKKSLSNKDIEALALKLKDNHIRYAYIFAGPYENDGHLPSYAFSQKARESIKILKKVNPELKILPWIGGIQNKTVHLEKVQWVKNAISSTTKLVREMPIDGIHLDLEYVLLHEKLNRKKLNKDHYRKHWIEFHKQLKMAMPHLFLSSVVVSTASETKPWKLKHTLNEIKEVSSSVDQLSFMFYETGIHDAKVYRGSLKEQLLQIQSLKKANPKSTQHLIGIGTFSEQKKLQNYRDKLIEDLPLTLKLLHELELEIDSKESIVDGLAIYCEWMTSDLEWKQLKDYLK